LVNSINSIEVFNNRILHHGLRQGETRPATPTSHRREGDGRSATELHRSTKSRGGERRPQKSLRPCHRLLSAAGRQPTTTYAIYTPRSVESPTSRRRSGRRRRGFDRIDGGEVVGAGGQTNRLSL
jgi:hypothetical protein